MQHALKIHFLDKAARHSKMIRITSFMTRSFRKHN